MSSEGATWRAPSVMSLDDPETREAAETLSGLRNMGESSGNICLGPCLTQEDFKRSPAAQHTTLPSRPCAMAESKQVIHALQATAQSPADEDRVPLLTLITSQHPWIGGTISGSLTAYNTSLQYSPAFIRNSANFLERNLSTGIEHISRRTGVDDRVRRYLGDRPASPEQDQPVRAGTKRRRTRHPSPDDDVERGYVVSPTVESRRSRAPSQGSFVESLPAYDDNRSPTYEEHAPLAEQHRQSDPGWRTQIIMTTSGLGAALSDTSLRSLKQCLVLLKQAFDHLATVIASLRKILGDIEQLLYRSGPQSEQQHASSQSTVHKLTPEQEAASRAIADRVRALGSDIMVTLQNVTRFVSQYTGRALPANAGALVRRQLLSVPQRYRAAHEDDATLNGGGHGSGSGASVATVEASPSERAAQEQQPSNTGAEAAKMGQRWLNFAEQGCEMIEQVTMIVSGTVESAERWLDTMGRKKEEQVSQEPHGSLTSSTQGEKTGGEKQEAWGAMSLLEKR